MSTQSLVEYAISAWVNGDRDNFKKILTQEKENILSYKGRGDIFTYFLPALLIEDFWHDLQAIDFPLERIAAYYPDIVGWLRWEGAVKYMYEKNKLLLESFVEEGLSEEQLYPHLFVGDSKNLDITLDYFNSQLVGDISKSINEYLLISQEDWDSILDKVELIIEKC